MSLNLKPVIKILGLKDKVTLERRGPATYVDGDAVHAEPETFDVRALIAPLPDLERMRLPEGDRNRETMVFYTPIEVKSASLAAKTPADVVLYDGKRFEVIREGDWQRQAKVYRAVIAKVEEG